MRSKRTQQAADDLFNAMLRLFVMVDGRRDAAREEYKARRQVETMRERYREIDREERATRRKGGSDEARLPL